jgi:hypothetical protein
MSYNGWTNRATWLYVVWEYPDRYCPSDFDSVHSLADTMAEDFEQELESALESAQANMPIISDLLSRTGEINFDEIARSIWSEEEEDS